MRPYTGITILGQSGSGSNGNKEILYTPLIFRTGALTIGCSFLSYSGHPILGEGVESLISTGDTYSKPY